MVKTILSPNGFRLLLGSALALCLFMGYSFWHNVFEVHSYLIQLQSGAVLRRVVAPYHFYSNMVGLIYALGAFCVICFVGIYGLYYTEKRANPIIIEAEPETDPNSDSNVFYGRGPINEEIMKHFVRTYPESALKFITHQNVDSSPLDVSVRSLHQSWIMRGMRESSVVEEINRIMGWTELPKRNLYELSLELKDRIEEQNAQQEPDTVNLPN